MDILIKPFVHTFDNSSQARQADRIQLYTLCLLLQKGQLMLHPLQILFQGIQHSTVITETLDHLWAYLSLFLPRFRFFSLLERCSGEALAQAEKAVKM